MGFGGRRLLARSTGGVRSLADGLLPLREMAAGRPLAADSGDAPMLTNDVIALMMVWKWHCRTNRSGRNISHRPKRYVSAAA